MQTTALESFKANQRDQWDRSAPGWDAHTPQIRAWLQRATDAMIALADIKPGSRVLDVAAGAGDQTLAIAARVGPGGTVLATDLSPAIIERARDNAVRAGYANVTTQVADGEDLGIEPAQFDAALCRLGLMLFPDPLQGLREMHRALRPGGRCCTLVFSRPERNPCVAVLLATALRHAKLPPRDPFQPGSLFSLGQQGQIDALFRGAGFDDVTTTALDAPFHLPSARHYLDFVRSSASPIQQIVDSLPPAAAETAWAEMEERLHQFESDAGWIGPNELLLTAGRR